LPVQLWTSEEIHVPWGELDVEDETKLSKKAEVKAAQREIISN
jgi:hypothetical protein